MSEIKLIQEKLLQFAKERDWEQFHTPKNLCMALSGEVGELTELFQWLNDEQIKKLKSTDAEKIEDELADVFLYLCRLAQVLEVDLMQASEKKILKNKQKYPIEKSKGLATKYTDL